MTNKDISELSYNKSMLYYKEKYPYLFDYYCKKYGENESEKHFEKKDEDFLYQANEICKWKVSFDRGEFYPLEKIDDTFLNSNQSTRKSSSVLNFFDIRVEPGEGCICILIGLGVLLFIIGFIKFKFEIENVYGMYIFSFIIGLIFLFYGLLFFSLARERFENIKFEKIQSKYQYALYYIKECSEFKERQLHNHNENKIELLDIYYETLSKATTEKINQNKDLI